MKEIEFLKMICSQTAVAFESSRLYNQTQNATKQLDKQMYNLSILYNLGQTMNFIDDLKKLLKLFLIKQ